MPAALYDIPDPRDRAAQYRQSAINSYSQQTPNIPIKAPPKTMGGAMTNAMGAGATGAGIGTMISSSAMAGPIGLAAGAIFGAASYFLS